MRKKLLALLLAAALALSLLAGCGGGESVASALLKLLDGRYPNISIEIDPELEADLRQAIRKAEAENAGDDAAVIRAALETALGSTITFRNLRNGQKGNTAFDLVFYAGSDPDKAAQAAYSQWNPILSNVPADGKYDTSLAMVETNSGVWMLVKATVEKAGRTDKPDSEPVKTSITVANDMLDDLNDILRNNPSITTVNFSDITKKIPDRVLSGTNVSKVIVSTATNVDNAFSGVSGLTIEVTAPDTGSGTVNRSILGGASGVTLDLSRSGITTIERYAFYGCTSLASVDLSSCTGLTTIGMYAFDSCTGLTSVDLSSCTGLTTIGMYAFYGCTGLTSVDLSSCTGLEHIEEEAFYSCTGLTSVTLPEGLTTIGVCAFYGCTGLTSVTLPEGLTDMGVGAFYGCTSLASVDLRSCTGLTTIGKNAFESCTGLTSVTFPESLTTIEIRAFYGCTGLTSIDLNDCTGLEHIKPEAFSGCDILNQVTLPDHNGAFSISFAAFALNSGPQPLHLRIPSPGVSLFLAAGSFFNRKVTVYCDPTIAVKIKAAFNEDIIGPNGTIEVKPLADW